jgi:streptogramin lyase
MTRREEDRFDRELRDWLEDEVQQPAPTRGLDAALDRTHRVSQRRRVPAPWPVLIAAGLVLAAIVAGLVLVGGVLRSEPAPTPSPTGVPSPSATESPVAGGAPVVEIPPLAPIEPGIASVVPIGGVPVALAASEGLVAVPFTDAEAGTSGVLLQPTSATGRGSRTVPLQGEACWDAAVAFDSVWTFDCGEPRGLRRTDLATGETSLVALQVPPCECHDFTGTVVATRDAMWLTTEPDGPLRRIDPVSGTETAAVALADGGGPIAVTNDAVWVASLDGKVLQRIEAETARVAARIEIPEHVLALAAVDDRLWLYGEYDRALVEVDASKDAEIRRLEANVVASDLVPGEPGTLWISDPQLRLFALDTASGTITTAWDAGDAVRGSVLVSYADGALWLADEVGHNLTRVRAP